MRGWRGFALLIGTLGTAASAASAMDASAAGAGRPLAFTSVTVLPMTPGEPVLRDHTVLVRNGGIVAVGPSASVRVPRNFIRIRGRGKYLMPGLADMHVHLEHFDNPAYLKLFLVNGVTFVRSMDGRPNILEWKRQIAARRLDGPAIVSAGQVLDGNPPVRDDNVALATPDEARRTVQEQAASGYDFIKVYTNLAPDVFRAIIETAAARARPVVGHMPRAVGLDTFLASGVRSVEHLGDFADAIAATPELAPAAPSALKRRLGFAADEARIQALAAKVAASGVWVVPTMITDERTLAHPDKVREWEKAPEMAAVDRGIQQYWRGSLKRAAERLGEGKWQMVEQGIANQRAVVRAFHRAKVPMLLGTDTPQPFVFPGSSVHDELANYVAAGLTPAQALALATREPARFLGQEREWGTIEPGKRANLLLLDANPLEKISATRRIAGVVAGGTWLPAKRLRQMQREVEEAAARSD